MRAFLSTSCFAICFFIALTVHAQQGELSSYPAAQSTSAAMPEPPYSIFNDKIRRFRFDFKNGPVTHEAVEAFVVRYDNGERPAIFGAYADDKTNSLIVVAGPEAEQAIRESLAESMVSQWFGDSSLLMTQRELNFRRVELISEMAQMEIALVDADENKAVPLKERLEMFERDLQIVEKKLQIVEKYLQRLNQVTTPEE